MDRIRIAYQSLGESMVRCTVDVLDSALLHHPAELRVHRTIVAKKVSRQRVEDGLRSQGAPEGVQQFIGALTSIQGESVVASETLLTRRIENLGVRNVIDLERARFEAFSYSGSMIDIEIHSELKVDDALLFDTKLCQRSEVPSSPRPPIDDEGVLRSAEIIGPRDAYDLMTSIRALSGPFRAAAVGLLVVGAILIGINTVVSVHDQGVLEWDAWFYSHSGRGAITSPIGKALLVDLLIAVAVWAALGFALRGYVRLELKGVPARIRRGDRIPANALITGRTRVPLESAVLRVVACNMEEVRRRTGKSTTTCSCPVRAVVLYEKQLTKVPANAPIETLLTGSIDFDLVFRTLYPPQRVTAGNGLELYWGLQLLHGQFVDRKVAGPVACFPWTEFLAEPPA